MNNVKESSNQHTHGAGGGKVKDPVCGMDIDPNSASGEIEQGGHNLLLLQFALPGQIPRGTRQICRHKIELPSAIGS